ncbi:MAG: site-2 protease family protein [Actinomycetota bacterium]
MSFDWLLAMFLVASLAPGIILHEVSHGLVASWFGDPTAREAGRLSLNPIRHVDPFGTVVLPGLLIGLVAAGVGSGVVFGYAKPVPVSANRLRKPHQHMIWISLAGPATNLLLAVLAAVVIRVGAPFGSLRVAQFLGIWIFLNAVLLVINMLPLPPLDGSSVVARFLPAPARRAYLAAAPYGMVVFLLLVFIVPGFLLRIVDPLVDGLLRFLVG